MVVAATVCAGSRPAVGGEELERFFGGRDSEEVLTYEIVGLPTRSRSIPFRRRFAIVFGTAKCHIWAGQRPACT